VADPATKFEDPMTSGGGSNLKVGGAHGERAEPLVSQTLLRIKVGLQYTKRARNHACDWEFLTVTLYKNRLTYLLIPPEFVVVNKCDRHIFVNSQAVVAAVQTYP